MPPKKFEGKFGIPASHNIDQELTGALYRLPDSINLEFIDTLTQDIVVKVNAQLALTYDNAIESGDQDAKLKRSLSEEQVKVLHLKLARHYEDNGDTKPIDMATCVDALIESPRFLESTKGSIDKLFEIHEMKTLQKIAEKRRQKAEMVKSGEYKPTENPYENLFETISGRYYLARLLNMPHLEEESDYMEHCVGTSDSYISKMKRGDVEILSFRSKDTDTPIVTIEYDVRHKRLLQVKGSQDRIPELSDISSVDLIDALEKLATTVNDQGEPRVIINNPSIHLKQLLSIREKMDAKEDLGRDDLLLLYEVSHPIGGFEDTRDPLVEVLLSKRNRKKDIETICNCPVEHIAKDFLELNESTQIYVEDAGDKLMFLDFREDKNKEKLLRLVNLVKKIKETGSLARLDMLFEGGMFDIDVPLEKVKDLPTAIASYEETDNNSPSWVWPEWQKIEYTKPESPQLEFIILSYNNDPSTRESSEKIVEDAGKLGLRPATFEEMIMLGIVRPEFHKMSDKYLVGLTRYSLGGVVRIPYLRWNGDKRRLDRDWWSLGWLDGNRFVFVRKST